MKSKQLIAKIASTCNLKQETAATVVEEVFRQIRAALDTGERVEIPDFGNFISREAGEGGEPGKRVIRFRPPLDDAAKQARAARRQERNAKGGGDDEDED